MTWSPEGGIRDRHRVAGALTAPGGDPLPVRPAGRRRRLPRAGRRRRLRHQAHQAWRHGEVLLVAVRRPADARRARLRVHRRDRSSRPSRRLARAVGRRARRRYARSLLRLGELGPDRLRRPDSVAGVSAAAGRSLRACRARDRPAHQPHGGQGQGRQGPRRGPGPPARCRPRRPQPRRAATPTRRSTWPASASPTGSRRWWSAVATAWSTSRVQAVAGTGTALGIIPAGTGNDVARYFDLPRKDPAGRRRPGDRRRAPAPSTWPAAAPSTSSPCSPPASTRRQRARQPDDLAQGPDALQHRHPGRAARLRAAALHPPPRRPAASRSTRCWSRSATGRRSAAACGSPRARCSTTACSTW